MAPEIDKVLNEANAGRRDFLRKIIAGAVFAPPLLVSFKLDGPSLAEALDSSPADMCMVTNATGPFTSICYDFSGTEYEENFTDVVGNGADIKAGLDLGGTGHTAVNFTGGAGPAGGIWATVLNHSPSSNAEFQVSLSADVLIHRYNNFKGIGLLALAYSLEAHHGLGLILNDAGNNDSLQLVMTNPAGQIFTVKNQFLGGNIAENAWYRLEMVVERVAGHACGVTPAFPNNFNCLVHVTGEVFRHLNPTDPDSALGTQVGGTLHYEDWLPFNTLISPNFAGQVGLIGRAISSAVDASVTNFCVSCSVAEAG